MGVTDLATSMAHVKAIDEAIALDDFVRVGQAAQQAMRAAKLAAAATTVRRSRPLSKKSKNKSSAWRKPLRTLPRSPNEPRTRT